MRHMTIKAGEILDGDLFEVAGVTVTAIGDADQSVIGTAGITIEVAGTAGVGMRSIIRLPADAEVVVTRPDPDFALVEAMAKIKVGAGGWDERNEASRADWRAQAREWLRVYREAVGS